MKNKLVQFFFFFIGCIVIFICLFSLFGPQGKKIDLKQISFSTTSSSELYYKNLRSYYYDMEERADAQFNLYRIKSREKDSLKHKLTFVIVHNWRFNESYIICEPFTSKKRSPFSSITLISEQENIYDTLYLKKPDNEANYIFAAQVYEKLTEKAKLHLKINNRLVPFTEEEQTSLKSSLKDYFKLVGKVN